MFGRSAHHVEEDDKKDVFAPVADLMVGVVFIFIILMIALSLNLVDEKGVPLSQYQAIVRELAEERERSKKLVADLEAQKKKTEQLTDFVKFVKESKVIPLMDRLSRADETRAKLLEEIRNRLVQAGVEVTIDPSNGTLRLPARGLFDSGRADPTLKGREDILTLGRALAETLPCYGVGVSKPVSCPSLPEYTALSAVYVEGHTDVVPITRSAGQFRDNWDLSAARAIASFKIIRESQAVLQDIRNGEGDALLGVSGYAEARPANRKAVDRRSEDAKDQDRRIEVRLTMSTDRQAVGVVLKELNKRLEAIDGLVR